MRDPLTIVSSPCSYLSVLFPTLCGPTKSFQNFESWFCASVVPHSFYAIIVPLPNSLLTLLLLFIFDGWDSQGVSIPSAAALSVSSMFSAKTNDNFIERVTYESVANSCSMFPNIATHAAAATTFVLKDCSPVHDLATLFRQMLEIAQIVKHVDKVVAGHTSFGDMRTLLQQNQQWNADVQKMLSKIVD